MPDRSRLTMRPLALLLGLAATALAVVSLASRPRPPARAPSISPDQPPGTAAARALPSAPALPSCPLPRKTLDQAHWHGSTLLTAGVPLHPTAAPEDEHTREPARDGSLDAWDLTQGRRVASVHLGVPHDGAHELLLAWAPDGKSLVIGGAVEGPFQWVTVWNTSTWQRRPVGSLSFPDSLAVSDDGRRAIVAGGAHQFLVIELPSGKLLASTPYSDAHYSPAVQLTPDGGLALVQAPGESGIHVLRTSDLRQIRSHPPADATEGPGVAAAHGSVLAEISARDAALLDARTGARLRPLEPADLLGDGEGLASSMLFSSDGRRLSLINGARKLLQVWDVASGRRLLAVAVDPDGAEHQLSPDGQLLLHGGKAFDTERGLLDRPLPPEHFQGWYGPHGALLADLSGCDQGPCPGEVRFEDPASGLPLRPPLRLPDLRGLRLSPDQRFLHGVGDGAVWIARLSDGARLSLGVVEAQQQPHGLVWSDQGAYDGPPEAAPCIPGTPRPAPGLLREFLR